MYSDSFILTDKASRIIIDMAQNGITRSLEQAHILKHERGIEVAPHFLAEFKYHRQKTRFEEYKRQRLS
jgi:DNA transposition AAA+ family ATPase